MSTSQNNRRLVVKDYSKLESYGFTKEGSDTYYFYTGNIGKYNRDVYTIYFSKSGSNKVYITSHANITLEVICKMYKDGVIVFEDNNCIEKHIEKKEEKIRQLEKEIENLKRKLNESEVKENERD